MRRDLTQLALLRDQIRPSGGSAADGAQRHGPDADWIALVALPMFRTALGQDMLTARAVPAVLFYLVYAAGIQVFVLPAGQGSWLLTALNGALFGLFCFATYDLTNYATLRRWTATLAVSDIAWGMVMTAVVSTLAMLAGRAVARWLTT
jgi:uncharacterized membrane protein